MQSQTILSEKEWLQKISPCWVSQARGASLGTPRAQLGATHSSGPANGSGRASAYKQLCGSLPCRGIQGKCLLPGMCSLKAPCERVGSVPGGDGFCLILAGLGSYGWLSFSQTQKGDIKLLNGDSKEVLTGGKKAFCSFCGFFLSLNYIISVSIYAHAEEISFLHRILF